MKNRSSGFTLAEVLVSIVIGIMSIAAAFSAYNYFNKSYTLLFLLQFPPIKIGF